MTDAEIKEKITEAIEALSVLKVYPLSPVVLFFILSYCIFEEQYWDSILKVITTIYKLDQEQFAKEAKAISVFMENNIEDLVKILKGDLSGDSNGH